MSRATRGQDADPPRSEFVGLYLAHFPRLVRVLTISTSNPAAAQDLAQEAFARTYKRWRQVRAGSNPSGYPYTVAFRLLRRRGGWRESSLDDAALASLPGAVSHEGAVVAEAVVRAAVMAMPARRRACVGLCLYLGYSAEEAAAMLGIAPATVRVQVHRARQDLHDALSDSEVGRPVLAGSAASCDAGWPGRPAEPE